MAVALTLAIAALSPTQGADSLSEAVVARGREAVVLIAVETPEGPGSGTGFFVDSKGWIVTNSHVIQGVTEAVAILESGVEVEIAGILADDRDNDVAVLALAEGSGYLTLDLGLPPKMGQPILVIGHPMGGEKRVTDGLVAADPSDANGPIEFTFTAKIRPGSSGSPVLSKSGDVVGIASSATDPGHWSYHAVSVDHIHAAVAGIEDGAEPDPFPRPTPPWANLLISLVIFAVLYAGYRAAGSTKKKKKKKTR